MAQARRIRADETMEDIVADLLFRVRRLESKRTAQIGGWSLTERDDGQVWLVNYKTGEETQLS